MVGRGGKEVVGPLTWKGKIIMVHYTRYIYICVCVYIYICNKNVARLACHGEEFACWALSRF